MKCLQKAGAYGNHLRHTASLHECSSHRLFDALTAPAGLTCRQLVALLKNYDVHAAVLRRLLLKAATIMPEEAVGFILENVRNEYGNGDASARHQLQLRDLASHLGCSRDQYEQLPVFPGVIKFVRSAARFYFPVPATLETGPLLRPAIAAGAITATELLAIEEFKAMQVAFAPHGLSHHIWFDHVNVEQEHSQESVALAVYFLERYGDSQAVELGLNGVLNANLDLYDGLLQAVERST